MATPLVTSSLNTIVNAAKIKNYIDMNIGRLGRAEKQLSTGLIDPSESPIESAFRSDFKKDNVVIGVVLGLAQQGATALDAILAQTEGVVEEFNGLLNTVTQLNNSFLDQSKRDIGINEIYAIIGKPVITTQPKLATPEIPGIPGDPDAIPPTDDIPLIPAVPATPAEYSDTLREGGTLGSRISSVRYGDQKMLLGAFVKGDPTAAEPAAGEQDKRVDHYDATKPYSISLQTGFNAVDVSKVEIPSFLGTKETEIPEATDDVNGFVVPARTITAFDFKTSGFKIDFYALIEKPGVEGISLPGIAVATSDTLVASIDQARKAIEKALKEANVYISSIRSMAKELSGKVNDLSVMRAAYEEAIKIYGDADPSDSLKEKVLAMVLVAAGRQGYGNILDNHRSVVELIKRV